MPIADAYNSDIFGVAELTAAINNQPYVPFEIGGLLPWNAQGITTRTALIEEKNGSVDLIDPVEPGAPASEQDAEERSVHAIVVPHYPKKVTVKPAEVAEQRAFGSENALETVEMKRDEKLASAARNHDATLEFARSGAIKGLITKKGGGTLIDLHAVFGVTRTTHPIDFATNTTEVIKELIEAKFKSEEALGDAMASMYILFAGKNIYNSVAYHASTKQAFDRYQNGMVFREDLRDMFPIVPGSIGMVSYHRTVDGVKFIGDDEAYLCPVADGLYETRFAPAQTNEFVNTIGMPRYAIPNVVDFNEGLEVKTQSNHVSWVNKPKSIVKVTQS